MLLTWKTDTVTIHSSHDFKLPLPSLSPSVGAGEHTVETTAQLMCEQQNLTPLTRSGEGVLQQAAYFQGTEAWV